VLNIENSKRLAKLLTNLNNATIFFLKVKNKAFFGKDGLFLKKFLCNEKNVPFASQVVSC
jgi:hypothetical protein